MVFDPIQSGGAAGPRMTILQVIPELDAGGAERTTVDITRALTEAGHRSVIVTEGGRLAPEITEAGGEIIEMPVASKSPVDIIANIYRLKKVIKTYNVSVVHARSRAPAWSSYLAAVQVGVPFLTTYHGTYSGRTYLKKLYNSIMVRGDRVIANSEFIARHIRDTYGLPLENIVTIPRGLDVDVFDPDQVTQDQIDALRADWNVPDARTAIILLPGRLTSWKGQEILIDAARILQEKGYTDFACVMVGDAQGRTAYEQGLRKVVSNNRLHDMVKIVGHCASMPAAYALSDVVISASTRPEAFGRIAIEAQAMMRPVIVADHGGAQETVLDGKTGWRVRPGDAEDLATKIVASLQVDPEVQAAMGEKARQRVLKHYSVDVMCRRTLNLYSSLVKSKNG